MSCLLSFMQSFTPFWLIGLLAPVGRRQSDQSSNSVEYWSSLFASDIWYISVSIADIKPGAPRMPFSRHGCTRVVDGMLCLEISDCETQSGAEKGRSAPAGLTRSPNTNFTSRLPGRLCARTSSSSTEDPVVRRCKPSPKVDILDEGQSAGLRRGAKARQLGRLTSSLEFTRRHFGVASWKRMTCWALLIYAGSFVRH